MKLYAISVDEPDVSRRLRQRLGADFTFLSDPDGKVLDLFRIRNHQLNPRNRDIAIPTSILVDRHGIVRWAYQSDDYRVRARPEEVLEAIGRLSK